MNEFVSVSIVTFFREKVKVLGRFFHKEVLKDPLA